MKRNRGLALCAALFASGTQAVDWGGLRCPRDSSGTLPTPAFGSDGMVFTVCTEIVINKPPAVVYDAVVDFRAYPRWNSFVVDIELPPNVTNTPEDVYLGMRMKFTTTGLVPMLNTTSQETVSALENRAEDGYSMAAWLYDDGIESRGEHPTILVGRGDGTTLQVSYETYYEGPGTLLILPIRDNLQAMFERQGMDLKAYVEGQ